MATSCVDRRGNCKGRGGDPKKRPGGGKIWRDFDATGRGHFRGEVSLRGTPHCVCLLMIRIALSVICQIFPSRRMRSW